MSLFLYHCPTVRYTVHMPEPRNFTAGICTDFCSLKVTDHCLFCDIIPIPVFLIQSSSENGEYGINMSQLHTIFYRFQAVVLRCTPATFRWTGQPVH